MPLTPWVMINDKIQLNENQIDKLQFITHAGKDDPSHVLLGFGNMWLIQLRVDGEIDHDLIISPEMTEGVLPYFIGLFVKDQFSVGLYREP
jgi:hypothetical protein